MSGADEQTARLERARSRAVYIATPVARHPVSQYAIAMARTLVRMTELGIRAYVQQVRGNSNLPRARNELVAGFLASDFDDLLFVDDDMGWHSNDVLRLLASTQDVIAGVGCKKVMRPDDDRHKWCFRPLEGPLRQDEMGAIEVAGVGTGFVKISRAVFMRFIAEHPDWRRLAPDKMPAAARAWYYQIFRFSTDRYDEAGEDLGFCEEWRRMGGSIWIDPTIKLVHVGDHEFTGDFAAMLQAEED